MKQNLSDKSNKLNPLFLEDCLPSWLLVDCPSRSRDSQVGVEIRHNDIEKQVRDKVIAAWPMNTKQYNYYLKAEH